MFHVLVFLVTLNQAVSHLPAGYFKKRGMSYLRLFPILYLNLVENPKNRFENNKMGGSSQKICIFGQNLSFLNKKSVFDPFIAKN